MKLKPAKSKMLHAYGYDPKTKRLSVQFKEGGPLYHYDGIEKEIHHAFEGAESKGTFFGSSIRGKYKHTKEDPK